ncbi:guanine nucleotide-binding protein alpha-4 subunit [Mycena leptocephala]|nr:guanine nucleotide-binding protein alpha-4 subunit [Mycena leptocephala]
MSRYREEDPLDAVLRPPPDETPEQAVVREAREAEARRVSAAIDADIKAERLARRKKRIVRLLLLGQSESGKSTTLRQFQRLYTPTAFREERILWRAVIQLNIVRSIRIILEALDAPAAPRSRRPSVAPSASMLALAGPSNVSPRSYNTGLPAADDDYYYPTADLGVDSDPESDPEGRSTYQAASMYNGNGASSSYNGGRSPSTSRFAANVPVEALLIARLVAPNEEEPTRLGVGVPRSSGSSGGGGASSFGHGNGEGNGEAANGFNGFTYGEGDTGTNGGFAASGAGAGAGPSGEIFVRPNNRWRAEVPFPSQHPSQSQHQERTQHQRTQRTQQHQEQDPQEALTACAPAMRALWGDPAVREVLRKRKIRLEEGPGFFLNDLERVTGAGYLPTDDDVLRARLKTVGVSEYTFEMEVSTSRETGTEWRIVDVGGSRSQRATWVPFFDDVDAIIFLAPIAGFDQVLAEDRTVNRLEDSVLLWKAVCSNKLLANVDLVLFLNKCDILERKLKAGVRWDGVPLHPRPGGYFAEREEGKGAEMQGCMGKRNESRRGRLLIFAELKLVRYVRSYADRENTFEAVSQYLRSKFSAIHREYSPNPRKFYAFCTSVTDTATTAGIIASAALRKGRGRALEWGLIIRWGKDRQAEGEKREKAERTGAHRASTPLAPGADEIDTFTS